MKLVNMNNNFSVFGNFAVFDEETTVILNQVYSNCNISMIQEPENKANRSGKRLEILDAKNQVKIILRPMRIDVQITGYDRNNRKETINKVMEHFKAFAKMFEGSYGTRIAYVSRDFIFDDEGIEMRKIGSGLPMNKEGDTITELMMRINQPTTVLDEEINVVTAINNAMIGMPGNPQVKPRKALMIDFDINTLMNNEDQRFDLEKLDDFFNAFIEVTIEKLKYYSALN